MTISKMIASAMMIVAVAGCSPAAIDLSAQDATGRPPAPTLQAPATPSKAPDAEGFIQRWVILEPIRRPGPLADSAVQAAVKKQYFADQFTVLPRDGDRVIVNDTALVWHAVDTQGYNVNLFHFAYALGKPTSNVLFWAVTVVDAPRDIPNVRLAICSNAASVWWLNGEEVIGIYNDRQAVIDDGVSKRVTLREGPNLIRAAVINGGGATDFCARFIDEQGDPVRDFTVSLGAR
jgi:hypothetical protein